MPPSPDGELRATAAALAADGLAGRYQIGIVSAYRPLRLKARTRSPRK